MKRITKKVLVMTAISGLVSCGCDPMPVMVIDNNSRAKRVLVSDNDVLRLDAGERGKIRFPHASKSLYIFNSRTVWKYPLTLPPGPGEFNGFSHSYVFDLDDKGYLWVERSGQRLEQQPASFPLRPEVRCADGLSGKRS